VAQKKVSGAFLMLAALIKCTKNTLKPKNTPGAFLMLPALSITRLKNSELTASIWYFGRPEGLKGKRFGKG